MLKIETTYWWNSVNQNYKLGKEKKKINTVKTPLTFGDHAMEQNYKQKNVYVFLF